jgi:leucine dehydrogenase
MNVFEAVDFDDHQQVAFVSEPTTGLRAIIAVHDTTLGPALGGCRMWNYASEEEALRDVLRLSKGMTYKAVLADVRLGGGKCVVMADPNSQKTPELLHALGRAIDRLKGEYITGPDIGTGEPDMNTIHEVTPYVIGISRDQNGYGDPSPSTAKGVYMGIRAGLAHKYGSPDVRNVRVAVQGLGHVGYNLCRFLHRDGADLYVADINNSKLQRAVDKLNAKIHEVETISMADVDVYAPCAFGATINDSTINRIRASIVAGGANNQLDRDDHGDALRERGIVYIPDYVANGGGLVQVAAEWYKEAAQIWEPKVEDIFNTCLDILVRADQENISTNVAADRIAEERINKYQATQATLS